MSDFDRPLSGFRFAAIQFGDTLQAIAARELDDAARWVDLVAINGLAPPYLTGDPLQAGPKVKLFGDTLIVPAPAAQTIAAENPDEVFGTDLSLTKGRLLAKDGDFLAVSGRANLRQALENRIRTETGELLFHLDYGCSVRRLLGKANGPTAGLLAAQFVRAAVAADPRIGSIRSAAADVVGDSIAVTVSVVPVSGAAIDISTKA